ncbi:MAG: 50S ribosomal protein L22 [Chlamydiia bacterium]|nr:50S ribosomal protein L22 [Chlamydiia bacterium]MCP5509305.1 50S ribosomal protein L22 [Chlamydiales bacterium]
MNQGKAITKYVRIAPRKARLAAGLIRGKNALQAMTELTFCNLKAGHHMKKTLMSAIANAETKHGVAREKLVVTEVRVDEGPTLKRAKTRSRGSRVPIMKRMSHLVVAVAPKENS